MKFHYRVISSIDQDTFQGAIETALSSGCSLVGGLAVRNEVLQFPTEGEAAELKQVPVFYQAVINVELEKSDLIARPGGLEQSPFFGAHGFGDVGGVH